MSWSVRGAGNLCIAGVLLAFGVSALLLPKAPATEPFGHVLLSVEWSDDDPLAARSSHRKLRLRVRPAAELTEAEVTVSLPAGMAIKAVEPAWDNKFRSIPTVESQRAIRASIGRLDAENLLSLEFELVIPPQRGGVVSFGIEGRDPDGRPVREAIGFVVGDSVSSGKPRLGAVEFPATVLPPEEPR